MGSIRRLRCRPERARRGMSLIEVLISSAVLGFGVVALGELFTTSERTAEGTRDREVATALALQRAELLGTMPVEQLPACAGAGTCRADRRTFAAARPGTGSFQCSQIVDDGRIPDPSITLPDGRYRIDTAIVQHPGLGQQTEARIVTVSVCWFDLRGTVHEVQVERLLVPEL